MAFIEDIGFDFEAENLRGLGFQERGPSPVRSAGLHVSTVISDLYDRFINPGQRTPFDHLSPEEQAKMRRYREMGFVWESIVERAFKQRMVQRIPTDNFLTQEEILHDGIYMTPDGVYMPEGDSWKLLEFKCTWKSARKTEIENIEAEMWEWLTQMKAYCYALDLTTAYLFVFHVNGYYTPSIPTTRGLEFTFTEEELSDTWNLITSHAATMQNNA